LHFVGKRANVRPMKKAHALKVVGEGSVSSTAKALRITSSAVSQWPEDLPPAIENRVLAELARRHLPPALTGIRKARAKLAAPTPARGVS
jgi:hypothetical protein